MTEAGPDWWQQALTDFGARLGFPATTRWPSDVLNFSVDGGKYLIDVERFEDDVVLAVLRGARAPEIEAKARLLLRTASFDHDHPFFLQVGLKGRDVLVLAARVERPQYHRLYDAFELIRKLYADIGL